MSKELMNIIAHKAMRKVAYQYTHRTNGTLNELLRELHTKLTFKEIIEHAERGKILALETFTPDGLCDLDEWVTAKVSSVLMTLIRSKLRHEDGSIVRPVGDNENPTYIDLKPDVTTVDGQRRKETLEALEECEGSKQRAAYRLGVTKHIVNYRLVKWLQINLIAKKEV